ncbi:MAG: Type 1 glutamine amidotransferase-like domain-containing protein [Thermoanaerobaculia bacterium]
MPTVTLLGPQRFTPTLGEAVTRAGISGRLASVTAGWQEREAEDLELHEHLGERTMNLMIYARSEDVLERDAELAAAYRERQERLRELQELYRSRLGHALLAVRELDLRVGDPALVQPERESALEALRDLDAHHLARVDELHAAFVRAIRPAERPAVERHARQISRQLDKVDGVAIAGGHVAILLNRMRLFDLDRKLAGKAIFAWSAGAMVISERVVLFHHFPPQGRGNTELLERGFGLARGLVCFPHARRRLALDDRRRVSLLARRFAPAICIAMADGASMALDEQGRAAIENPDFHGTGMSRFQVDGSVAMMSGEDVAESA